MKYIVYGAISASIKIGEYEADSEKEALEKADLDTEANWLPSLCWQCAREIDIGDVYQTEAVEIS